MTAKGTQSENPKETYQTLTDEITHIMQQLSADEIDIDQAIAAYERGLIVMQKLTTYLESATHKITKLEARYHS